MGFDSGTPLASSGSYGVTVSGAAAIDDSTEQSSEGYLLGVVEGGAVAPVASGGADGILKLP